MRLRILAIFVAIIVCLSALFSLAAVGISGNNTCHNVNTLRAALVTILDNGKRGLPSNPYYKAHPDQLADALAGYEVAIQKVEPLHC